MRAVQLPKYEVAPELVEVPDPEITAPLDIIVRIGGAGVCRTDLHIIEGQWAEKTGVALPYTLGHENAGWVSAVGSAVTNVAVGDPVILHPLVTCGLCRACRFGDDVHCTNSSFPGIDSDGGYADYLKTTARSAIKLDSSLRTGRRRRAGRRRADGLPRRGQGGPAIAPGRQGRGDRGGRARAHRRAGAARALAGRDDRRRPQRGRPCAGEGSGRRPHDRRRTTTQSRPSRI